MEMVSQRKLNMKLEIFFENLTADMLEWADSYRGI